MFAGIASLLGAGALGAILKILAALLQGWLDASQRKHEIRLAELHAHKEAFYGQTDAGAAFTRGTRRMLALSIVWTFCAILAAFAYYPDVPILILAGEQTSFSLLWGIINIPQSPKTIEITTGGVVWAAMHWVSLILTAYFMPIGRK